MHFLREYRRHTAIHCSQHCAHYTILGSAMTSKITAREILKIVEAVVVVLSTSALRSAHSID